MSDVKDKIAKAKQLNRSKQPTFTFKDENTKLIATELQDIKKSIADLAKSYEKGIDVFDRTDTNDLLEQSLDKAVELQKESDGRHDKLVKEIVEQIAKIRPVVNLPEQKQDVVNKIIVSDWKKEYMFSDSDKSEGTTYVGFVNPKGGWYIERVSKSKTSDKARFIFGSDSYVSNWGNRLKHNYKLLYEAING